MVTHLQAKDYGSILATVPRSIKDALECPPLQELINQGAKVNDLEACLALEIARVANMLTVGGNLRQGQSLEIARSLIADYPCESLQDFCLCLRNGIKGAYGDIFRFDILVISDWFKKYLADKYDAVVEKLNQEKDNQYTVTKVVPISGFRLVPDYRYVNSPLKKKEARTALWQHQFFRMSQMTARKPSPLTDKDIKKEGQIKPVFKPHAYTEPGYQKAIDAKVRKGRELHFRDNYPNATGEQIKEYLDSFES